MKQPHEAGAVTSGRQTLGEMGASRRTLLAAAAALGAGSMGVVLAACNGGTAAPQPAKQLQGTVEFWTNSGYPFKDNVGAQLADEFMTQHPTVKIAWTDTAYGDFMTKLVTTAVSGNPPDLSYADRYVTESFACKGAAAPLDAYVKQSKSVKLDNFWPLMRDQITYKGQVYAMPHQGNVGLLFYNKSFFRESGLDPEKPPTTWDATLQAIPRLAKRSGAAVDRVGWVPTRGWGVPWMVPYWQLGGELLDKDEKKAIFNNDTANQVFEWLLKLQDAQGGDDAIAALYNGLNIYDALSQGKTAMVWSTNTTLRTTFSKVPGLDVGVTFWPTPPNGKHANYMGGWSLIIPKGAKNPDAAFVFLEYFLGDDPQQRWADTWESLPSTKSAAQSDKYLSGRPERKIAVADAPFAKFVVGAPGGDAALKYESGLAATILSRQMTVRDALNDAVTNVQKELDDAARACAIQTKRKAQSANRGGLRVPSGPWYWPRRLTGSPGEASNRCHH
jgi:multiple sugar transport system substrate-binding protein